MLGFYRAVAMLRAYLLGPVGSAAGEKTMRPKLANLVAIYKDIRRCAIRGGMFPLFSCEESALTL